VQRELLGRGQHQSRIDACGEGTPASQGKKLKSYKMREGRKRPNGRFWGGKSRGTKTVSGRQRFNQGWYRKVSFTSPELRIAGSVLGLIVLLARTILYQEGKVVGEKEKRSGRKNVNTSATLRGGKYRGEGGRRQRGNKIKARYGGTMGYYHKCY